MYAATPEPGNDAVNASALELHGVRGAHLADAADVDTAWRTSTGRPDVVIAVHDSGIEWDDVGAMRNVRRKAHLNLGELPTPRHDRRASLEPGQDCRRFRRRDDANGDGVVNVVDFSCDRRVQLGGAQRARRHQPRGDGVDTLLDPQDVLIAFSDRRDDDRNGYVDDIVGWDFLDDDNDPYDDVQYGHGTGEAQDSTAEAGDDNGRAGDPRRNAPAAESGVGTCPNCQVMFLRVGDSFVADVNRFAQAVVYATDNGALVVQEALGALNNSRFARDAVAYALRHGVTVIASAADEAAQHHHWPESYPGVIVVNSVTKYDPTFTPVPRSYLQFNGCTNFSSKISVAIPSVSCSSDATGRASGMAGIVLSAALDLRDRGRLAPAPAADCRRVGGRRCAITPDEVRQLLETTADDVDFALARRACAPVPLPGCTDPQLQGVPASLVVSPLAESRRYPAGRGFDQFYGHGRVNMAQAVGRLTTGAVPPTVTITAPEWFAQVDPSRATAEVAATLHARGAPYTCRVLVAPGSYPSEGETTDAQPGDFEVVPSAFCDGRTPHTERHTGVVASLDVAALKARFPADAGAFDGRESGALGQTAGGRPDAEPYGFTVRVEAVSAGVRGGDRRNLYLHRDRDLLPGFPRPLDGRAGSGDVESSPLFVDLDGDNRNELLVGGSDGVVHAFRRDGGEARGWPVRTDRLPLHRGRGRFRARGAILASLAAGDLDRDGVPEVVAADLEGKVYVWGADGRRRFVREAEPRFSGRPLRRFVPQRRGVRNRTQHGFIASPVIADLDGDGRQEIVAAAMDRHVYAWHADGRAVAGFPVLVVDRSKVRAIDRRSHRVVFRDDIGEALNQGAIVDTPAVGDITGDGRPEIVVGTNEEYPAAKDGGLAVAAPDNAALSLVEPLGILNFANSRLYAIRPQGGTDPFVRGFPVKIGKVFAELLPVVGEGITGAPVIGEVTCPNGGRGPKIGVIPDGGPAMVLNADGSSCLGSAQGRPIGMQSDIPTGNPLRADLLALPAVGHPAFGDVGGGLSFLAPTTGLLRALDLTVNEYQGGEDSVTAWDPATGQMRAGFPARQNDLSFLTGPSVGDVGGAPGEEVVGGTAYLDLHAFGAGGVEADGWPKLTSDWMVANPLLGSWGTRDTAADARRVVVAATRAGDVFAYGTPAAACAPASWPRFHHDNANSGDARRDAVAPGVPEDLRVAGASLTFAAPGDDLLCGAAARYESRVGAGPWRPVPGVAPGAAGTAQTVPLPAGAAGQEVALRAVDEQGNVSRPAGVRVPR